MLSKANYWEQCRKQRLADYEDLQVGGAGRYRLAGVVGSSEGYVKHWVQLLVGGAAAQSMFSPTELQLRETEGVPAQCQWL